METADIEPTLLPLLNALNGTTLILRGEGTKTHESVTRYLEEVPGNDDFLPFSIANPQTDKDIGCCTFQYIDWEQKISDRAIIG